MAIVVDAAREDVWALNFNTVFQNGNDNPNTPTPTWMQSQQFLAGAAETHIPNLSVSVTPVDNTADAWLPASEDVWLASTPDTRRFA